MRSVLDEKRDGTGQGMVRASKHPLPWRNQPSGGEKHGIPPGRRRLRHGWTEQIPVATGGPVSHAAIASKSLACNWRGELGLSSGPEVDGGCCSAVH